MPEIFYNTKRERDIAEAKKIVIPVKLAKYHMVQQKIISFLEIHDTINKNIINGYCLPYKEETPRSHLNIADWIIRSMIENGQLIRHRIGIYKLP